jgi:hypothetical protein
MGLTVGSVYLLFRRFKIESRGNFNAYSIADAFDSDCVALWRTQIRALQLLYDHGKETVAIADICAAYRHAARCFPELYEGIKFQQWYEFLKAQGIVATEGRFAALTPTGINLVAIVCEKTDVRKADR